MSETMKAIVVKDGEPLHLADEEVGYRYPADANVRYTQTEPPDVSVYATNVLTNNDGLPASR